MKPEAIAENFLASILAATLIALVAYLFSRVRNFFLERQLRNAIDPNGVGVEFNLSPLVAKFNIQIHNYANAAIRVRTVVLVCDKFHVELTPSQTLFQTPLSNEAVRPKFPRKFLPRDILAPDNNPHAVLLPAKTMSFWSVDTQQVSSREWIVEKVFMVFEYATIFGNVAMVRIEAKGSAFDLIKKNFESLARAAYRKEPLDDSHSFANKA
jgi:hypothetical protein